MTQNHNAYSRMFRAYPDALSLKDLSKMFGVSTKQASKLIHDGKIAAVKVGREYRIAKINAIKFLSQGNENILRHGGQNFRK